jgi:signal transduction histidine kinase
MPKQRSIKDVIYTEYLKAALLPILIIEVTLLVGYFAITAYLANSTRAVLLDEASRNIAEIAAREARNINQQLDSVTRLGEILQKENARFFTDPKAFALPAAEPRFGIAPNGVHYKLEDNGGGSLWYSSTQPFSAAQTDKARRSEAMDPLYKAVLEANPNIVGVYFNSWDSMNRYYPFLDKVYEVFDPAIDIPKFNFYYEADLAHNPKRSVVWTEAYLDPAGQGWMASCIAPIWRGDFLEGVTGIDMTIDRIVKNILSLDLPWQGSAFLVDKTGTIIAMPGTVETVMGLKELREQVYTDHVKQDTVKPEEFNLFKNRDPAIVTQFQALFASPAPVHDFTAGGHAYFLAENAIERTDWKLMLLVSKEIVNKPIDQLDQLTRRIGVIAFLVMVAFYVGFFSFLMVKSRRTAERIAAPLDRLAERTTQFKERLGGVFDDLEGSGIKELDSLNADVSAMGTELGSLYNDLDAKVKNRTAELEQAMTELKLANQQLIQQEKMASIGQLAAGVAHEINNPLAFIMGNLGLMRDYTDRLFAIIEAQRSTAPSTALDDLLKAKKFEILHTEMPQMLDETLEGAERVKRIVSELRTFSRLTIDKELADINKSIDGVISLLSSELRYRVTIDFRQGQLPLTMCNESQLKQVFMNLIMNAAQAITGNGRIEITTELVGNEIVAHVADNGCGMGKDTLKRVFEPFFTTKPVGSGTGLGLSVSYEIIQKHLGTISVESAEGVGTTFTVRIPVTSDAGGGVPAIDS